MIRDKSVCVCICGFAPRSIKYTYESIQKNIIDPLNKHFFSSDSYRDLVDLKLSSFSSSCLSYSLLSDDTPSESFKLKPSLLLPNREATTTKTTTLSHSATTPLTATPSTPQHKSQ